MRVQALLETNLAGYLLKQEINESLLDVIRAVMHGATWFSRPLVEHLMINKATPASALLSTREHEVLKLVAQGERNRKIAQILCISENTLEHHISHIYQKLGVKGRTAASQWYWDFYHQE